MERKILPLIRTKYNTLSASQKKVADYVLANPQEVIILPLAALSQACDVSEPTVLRFLRKLDYDSYQVFRVHIAQETAGGPDTAVYDDVARTDSCSEVMQKIVQSTMRAIGDSRESIDVAELEKLVDWIHQSSRIVVVGVGASAVIARDAYHKLLKLGRHAVCCDDPHFANILCNQLGPDELLIGISHSGESREILDAVRFAAVGGCKVAAITSYSNSTLWRSSQCRLLSSSLETVYRSDAMTSRIIQLMIIDILYVSLSLRMGESGIQSIQKSSLAVARNKT